MPNKSCVLVCRVADLMLTEKDVFVRGNRQDGVAVHSATSSQGGAELCVATRRCVQCAEIHRVYVLMSTAISWLSVAQQDEAALSGLAAADPLGGFSKCCVLRLPTLSAASRSVAGADPLGGVSIVPVAAPSSRRHGVVHSRQLCAVEGGAAFVL